MNSRFKFVQSVNPQPIPTNTIRPKFSKLTLATTKFVAVESINTQKDSNIQSTQKVTCTTTTRTTMTNVLNDPPVEDDNEELSCAQKPKILLYDSTQEDNQSDILTDDDTDSVGSSIDSKEIEEDLKEISQPTTQGTVAKIDNLETQMQNLSFLPPSNSGNLSIKSDENLQNMSRQFDQLDLQHDNANKDTEEKNTKDDNSLLSGSVQTLSSTDTLEQEPISFEQSQEKNASDDVIVLSDTDCEDNGSQNEPSKRNISQEPPLKPTSASSNNGILYNISSIDSSAMEKVNQFFNEAPFIPPTDSSFSSSHTSKSTQEDVFVPETTDEESIDDEVIESSIVGNDAVGYNDGENEQNERKEPDRKEQINENTDQNKFNFSDNNIVFDIPVIKSTSDQPKQLIRSQSGGVRLTASRSSPIIKTTIDSDCIKRTSSNVILKTPTSIRVNSANGQSINIAAKININFDIQIVEDSSEESSEDNKPPRKSEAIQSSEDCQRNSDGYQSANSNHTDDSSAKLTSSKSPKRDLKNAKTPPRNSRVDDVNTQTKTPTTASKIKQFAFVPPKSMTKYKKTDRSEANQNTKSERMNKSIDSEKSEMDDGFQVDKNIPINARDQKLLHKVYGNAWKTPEVIRSYSSVKGKPDERTAVNTTPSVFKDSRQSKGFDLFKQKIKTNLNSTRFDDHAEISNIETPERIKRVMKSKTDTPRPKLKPSVSAKKTEIEPSPSVLTKKKPSPKSTKKKSAIKSVAADDHEEMSIITPRPRRNVVRKPIFDSEDESNKENETDYSSDDFSDTNYLTNDDTDDSNAETESIPKPRSVRGKNGTGVSATKRPEKKTSKNDLIYLDLSSEEVATVDENYHNVPEDDLANITRKFLETDLNDEEKPKKKIGRKLFTHNYDDIDEEPTIESEPRSIRKKPLEEPSLNIEIPRFTHKLFDSKTFGSPSINKTPKTDLKKDEPKTPVSSKIFAPKTPLSSARSKLNSPPKTFETYGFLKSLDVQSSMFLCHPDAKKYRENFKPHKEELTNILYKMYNEKVFDSKLNVDIQWNKKLTTTAGRFHGRTKSVKVTGKNHHIELSEKVLTSADRLRCTLIHEMCHAATWIFNGEKGHGIRWKSWAKKANYVFPELPTISVCHNYDIEYKYTYKCDMCHSKSYSHSKSKKVENIRCSYCHGMISIFLNKKKDGQTIMEPVREANGFAKFVKEKYKDFKKPGVKHADVMRQISSLYSTLSQEEKKQY
ncbi:titin-like [Contarinia nasturtii]|uniref:titin-like n=1 Tax=Contarinia nasturtii TaxID=265458 RepID=UPI0012D4269F|nr:titin-like [Contarinia nasturtii]